MNMRMKITWKQPAQKEQKEIHTHTHILMQDVEPNLLHSKEM